MTAVPFSSGARLSEAQNELGALKTPIDRLVAAIAEFGHSRALLAELGILEEQQCQAYRRMDEIQSQVFVIDLPDPEILSRHSIAVLDGEDLTAKKEILRTFIIDVKAERLDSHVYDQLHFRLPHGEPIGFVDQLCIRLDPVQ